MRARLFTFFLLSIILGACAVPKDVAYFQGIDTLTDAQIEQMSQTYVSKISTDDLLTIAVTAWDPTVATPFNPPAYAFSTQGETAAASTPQLHTYQVDQAGNINFPVLGLR